MNGKQILEGHFDVIYQNVYSYTAAGYPFVNHHWLSGVVFYLLLMVMGWGGLVIFKAVVLLAAFGLLFATALKKADFWLVAFFSLPTILILMERDSLRPEIFSYLLIALYLYLLVDLDEHPERKRIFWLIPLQLLWVNLHIFFSIGIMLVAGFLAEKMLLASPEPFLKKFSWKGLKNAAGNSLVRRLALLLVALALVSCVNPHGITGVLYRYPSNFPIQISENQSIAQFEETIAVNANTSVVVFKILLVIIAVSFIFGFQKKRKPFFYFFATVATAVLSFIILRGIVFFGMLALPVVTNNLDGLFVRLRDWFARESLKIQKGISFVLRFGLIGVFVFLLLPSSHQRFFSDKTFGIGLAPRSEDSAQFMKDNNIHGPIFNDTDSGSYLIYNLYPKEKVFADNLFGDAYPAAFFSGTYLPMLSDENVWLAVSQKYDFNVIFVYQYDGGPDFRGFLFRRMQDPAWALVYGDTFNLIYVRNTPENQAVIQKYGITATTAEERLKSLVQSSNFDDQVAAGDIFNLVGRGDLSAKVFSDVVARWPEKSKIWMVMGEWELTRNDHESDMLAMMYLDKALSLGNISAETYSFLGVAYVRLGYYDKARDVLRKALDINPERQDAKDLLATIEKQTGK